MLCIEKCDLSLPTFHRDVEPRCGMCLGIAIEQASGGLIVGGIYDEIATI